MRQRILLAGILPFVSAFLGGVVAFSLVAPRLVQAQQTRIAAERLAIVGDDGAERVRLTTGPGAIGSVGVFSPDGATTRVTLATGGSPVLGGTSPESAGLNIFADDGTQIV